MRVKTFEGKTEQEVLDKIKNEMGVDAVVLNIKKINTNGFLGMFKGSKVEITAAIDNDNKSKAKKEPSVLEAPIGKAEVDDFLKNIKTTTSITKNEQNEQVEIQETNYNLGKVDYTVLALEGALKEKERLIKEQEEQISKLSQQISKSDELISSLTENIIQLNESKDRGEELFANEYVQIVYDTLIEQNVMDAVALDILKEVKDLKAGESDLNKIVKVAYNNIIKLIGEPYQIDENECYRFNSKVILFMGPTGVGKTTTIAKLASKFILEKSMSTGLITADTYRMGAVDQLRMYADILDVDLVVAYTNNDLKQGYENMNGNKNIIFVDTAGRSHKNDANVDELVSLINEIPDCEKFLVVSLTTKSEDILSIVNTYNQFIDFKIIFSKSDETNALGAIVNTCYLTGKQISYITNGQIVPNDISLAEPEAIAKSILGLGASIV